MSDIALSLAKIATTLSSSSDITTGIPGSNDRSWQRGLSEAAKFGTRICLKNCVDTTIATGWNTGLTADRNFMKDPDGEQSALGP